MLDGLLAVSPQPGSASRPEEVVPVLERGKRLRPLTGGARSLHRPVLPEDGYDAGVKKPVAVPKKWTVPSGKVWVTSKLQVTRSPCALCLDLAVVSLWVGPPGGLNCCWPESQQAAAFVVAQGLDVHLGPLGQLPGPQSLVAHWQAAVIASPRGRPAARDWPCRPRPVRPRRGPGGRPAAARRPSESGPHQYPNPVPKYRSQALTREPMER